MSADIEGLDFIQLKKDATIFVESGSGWGDSVAAACKAGFEKIYSIELDNNAHEKCVQRFGICDQIKLIKGDSLVELPKLIQELKGQKYLLWLDAHGGGIGCGEDMDTFLPRELEALKLFKDDLKDVNIGIDDINFCIWKTHIYDQIVSLLKVLKPEAIISTYKSVTGALFLTAFNP